MPVQTHVYDLPDENELAQLVGAATPHFATQIRARVQSFLDALPADHPRAAELRAHIARLERLGLQGESGGRETTDLPPGDSLSAVARGATAEPPS